MAPITRASGTRRVVLARVARNKRLADAIYLWSLCSLQVSGGARAFYDRQRDAGKTHHQALRALGNRWVGHPARLPGVPLDLQRDRCMAQPTGDRGLTS